MNVYLKTPHALYKLSNVSDHQTLYEVCIQNRIPHGSVSFYIKRDANSIRLHVGLFAKLQDFLDEDKALIIQPNRNIKIESLALKSVVVQKRINPSTEYSFQSSHDLNVIEHIEFTDQDCKLYVEKSVTNFLESIEINNTPIVVGISGGGDSNTLLDALIKSGKVDRTQIIAVMCLGLPTWNSAKSRAEKLCKDQNISLEFVNPEEISTMLGKRPESTWLSGFEEVFNSEELAEVLGTFVVRLALYQRAKSMGAQAVITGLNLEDILAECYLRTMQGKLPIPFPVRVIDDMPFWFPLFKIPKKILDGCHPKFSFKNYEQRSRDELTSRALIYYLSESLNSLAPGAEFDLLSGYEKLALTNSEYYSFYDKELGFSTSEKISSELKARWKYFTAL